MNSETPTCSSCRREREAKDMEPRRLVQFSGDAMFKDARPLNLCSHCDGEEVVAAITRDKEDS